MFCLSVSDLIAFWGASTKAVWETQLGVACWDWRAGGGEREAGNIRHFLQNKPGEFSLYI